MGLFISKKQPVVEFNEIQQIEQWTNMKIGRTIFDSDVDNWKKETSVFNYKVINKSNLIFLIEDGDGNLFGGYINAVINGCEEWITDSNSFLFSLKSNGRLNGMLKFDNICPNYSFYLYNQSDDCLLALGRGGDVHIGKEHIEGDSYCSQFSFNYKGIENALCGKEGLTPIRITVIQLI